MKTLLKITPYSMTGKELAAVGKKFQNPRSLWGRLPMYCLRSQEPSIGKVMLTEEYHQWTVQEEVGDDFMYHFFDANPISFQLQEEVNNMGVEEFISGLDIKKLFFNPVIDINNFNSLCIPSETFLVIDIEYIGSGDDFDMNLNLIGYLDKNLTFQKI